MNKLTLIILTVVLVGCATPQSRMPTVDAASSKDEARKQREMVVEEFMSSYDRLQSVSAKILVKSKDYCGDKVGPYYGISVWTIDEFNKDWKEAVQTKFGLTEKIQISNVSKGSVADSKGFKVGDIILSLNGWVTPVGKDASNKFREKLHEFGKADAPVDFLIKRGSDELSIKVQATQACDFFVSLSPEDVKNAYADGKKIVVYKGMMDFFKTEEELALVFSHELAHNSMKHLDAQATNATLGALAGLVLDIAAAVGGVNTNGDFTRMGGDLGSRVYSVEFEQEADYVGLYIMANAGYEIKDAPTFWRRMATANSNAITMKSSHPTTPERFLALESTVKEIKAKIEQGKPLRPDMKKDSSEVKK